MKPTQSTWAAGAFALLLIGLLSFQFSGNREETPRLVHARPADAPVILASSLQSAATLDVVSTPNTNITAKNRLTAKAHRTGTAAESEFTRFDQWADKYRAAAPADRAALEAEGVELAHERRAVLRDLIQADPARALERALPFGIRQDLPATVGELLEERVTGHGSLDVFAALPAPGQRDKVTPTFRKATIDGRTYDAFVYGRRLGEPTRQRVALNGVAVDSLLALNESPLRVLDARETARRLPALSDAVCAVSGNPAAINGTPLAADVGGEMFVLCGPSHALRLSEQLINAEVAANAGGAEGGLPQPNVRTEGTKRLILIRVDFSDLAGTPLSDSAGDMLISGLNTFYMESSYGRSGFAASGSGSSVTPTLRMPQTASYYGNNDAYIQLRTDARNAAVTAGYSMGNYDYDLICFGSVPGWYWAGLGYVGASGAWLRNYFTVGVAGHELGHNFGLNHANFWDTGEQSVIGGDGSSEEYGDSFDTMGSGNPNAAQFNASYKSYMNWLHVEETTNVTASGTYRIYAHDDTNSTGLRGLRIARSSSTNYWVEFRQRYTGNKWLMSGAGIRWSGNGNEKSHLLDTTPGSPDGRNDSALVLGRTFSDSAAGIHITTLRKAGTTPESLDIAVNLGTFPGNANPVVAVTPGTTTAAIGATVTFSAAASDNDGDSLAYYWDFGDGTFGTNGTVAGKSWGSTGEYVVRCVASDMKGGQGSDSVVVTVGTPSTFQIAGRITAYGSPLEGVRVSVSTMRVTYSDSDGYYTLAGISPGSYTVSAVTDGYDFTPLGFSNPVTVGPSRTGINFDGELTNGGGGGSGGTATMTSPGNNASYTAPASIVLSATATASSLQILTNVSFFQGSTKLGEDTSSPYTYAWNNVAAGNYLLTARGTDTAGLISTSAPISVVVLASAPAITSQPQSQSVTAGGNVTLSVSASGSGPLSYRWRFNGSTINGATSPTLGLNNVQPLQAGAYTVVITNVAGTTISAVANLTVTCSYTLSASSTSIGASGGSRSVNVASAGGCSWTVTNVPSWIVITAGNGGSGNGTVTFSVMANTNGTSRSTTLIIAGRNHTVSQSAPDLSRPSVAFSSPTANSTHSNSLLTVTGTAEDNDAIAHVDYALNGLAFATATGTEDWSAFVTLIPGTNILTIRSVDVTGNFSLTNTRSIFCIVSDSLTLAINGEGTVSGATNGQALPIGRVCKLTAVPTTGFVFSNWTGGVSGNSPSLSFMMQSNLAVVANFVTNPFAGTRGVYNGLFYETNEVRVGSSGAFTFALADKGSYSASLRLGKKTHKTSGKLQLDGKATNTVTRPGTNSITIIWSVNLEGAEQISGMVSDNAWTAELLGDRAVFTRTNPAPHAGKYTLVLFGSPGALLAPEGDSYGTASVGSNGVVKLKGYLADKTSIATKVPTSRSGQWPLYVPLYSGQGAVLGWAGFTNTPSADLEAIVNWSKPALPSAKYHPEGFTAQAALLGSRYTPPAGPTNAILALTDALLVLEGGNLPASLTNVVTLGSGSRVTNTGPVDLKMSFTLSSGLFKGGFTPPGANRPLPFVGAVLQKANYASGYFLSTNKSGRVSLEAVP